MTAESERPRGPGALLRDPTFGSFFAGKVLSTCGTWLQNLAAAVLVFDLTRSSTMVGAVAVAQFAPMLLLSLWAGAISDRVDRRKLIIVGRLLSGIPIVGLAVLILLRGPEDFGGVVVLLLLVFVSGTGFAVSQPAVQAIVPALVPPRDLEPALALSGAAPGLGRTVGPALSAGLLLLGGPALAFAVAGPTHLLFAFVLLAIRPRPQVRPRSRAALFGGLHYLKNDRKAAVLVLGGGAIAVGADPVVTLTPALAAQMGGGDEVVGLFATAFGVGAVGAVLVLGPVRRVLTLRTLGMFGFWVMAVGLVLVALSPVVPPAAVGFAVAGIGFTFGSVALTTRVQRRVPDELRGRVMALWGMAFLGTRPLAAMLDGLLADTLGLRAAVLVAALITAASSLLARVSYEGR